MTAECDHDFIKWGFDRHGRQRWKCRTCRATKIVDQIERQYSRVVLSTRRPREKKPHLRRLPSDKQGRYRARHADSGRCPHCGKPCAPYYECEERRRYNRLKARNRRPRIKMLYTRQQLEELAQLARAAKRRMADVATPTIGVVELEGDYFLRYRDVADQKRAGIGFSTTS